MRRQKKCRSCGQLYTAYPQTYRRQKVCSKAECQAQRRCSALRHWHQNNPDYDDGREKYLQKWRKDHPRDWSRYRKDHPEATRRNREQQRKRDRKRRNLAKRNDSERVCAEKINRIQRLGDLAKRNDSIPAVLRHTEEIRRCLAWHVAACKTKRL